MKLFSGKVISDRMQKTVVVEAERFFRHPLYEKRVRRTKKYHAHDELGTKVGDTVKFVNTRPLSKTKSWKIVEILGRRGTEMGEEKKRPKKQRRTKK